MSGENKTSYFNTLVFTIIAAIVSLLLLLAMFFDMFKNYMTFIITVEVGIFLIIIFCLYQIISNESKFAKYKNASNFNIKFNECPDYYVRKNVSENGKNVGLCSNEYIVQDAFKNKFIAKIYPDDNPATNEVYNMPAQHTSSYNSTSGDRIDKFPSDVFDSALNLPTTAKKCAAVMGKDANYIKYSRMPYVGLTARCENVART